MQIADNHRVTNCKDGISEYLALGDRYDTRSKERLLGTVSKVAMSLFIFVKK